MKRKTFSPRGETCIGTSSQQGYAIFIFGDLREQSPERPVLPLQLTLHATGGWTLSPSHHELSCDPLSL